MTKKTTSAYRASKEETIPINKLHPFSNHPFHIRHDLEFSELVDSISESGIITPIIVRPKVGVGYEVISGHRRWEACKELGIESIPARVEYIDDDEATILMVNSNIQREHVLPSEKAFAYKMRMEAMKHQGKATSSQLGTKLRTLDKLYKMAPGKTAQSINVSLGLRMSAFNIPSIANICADDTIDLRELGSEKKVALFVVTPDTTTAYNFLAAVMFQQCFQILVDIADHRPDKRLPRHLRFLLDEFPNIGMIPDFQILISTIRSRDIACTLIYQSLNQLKSQYKDDWATIYENCDSLIVLGAGGNPENLEFFSKALGKATIEVMNTSENKGSQGSYTKSYQALGRELMTPEEIRTMPRNWCLLMISGVAPFYSRKYNLKDHPNYHLVEAEGGKPFDYDRRAEQSFADFISNVKDVKTVKLCAENNN